MLYIFLIIFVVCFCATMWKIKPRSQEQILVSILGLLTLFIGLRSLRWPDTEVYVMAFVNSPDIIHILQGEPYGYGEYGYYAICCFVKTFTDSWRVYLLVMGALSMWLLYKNLKEYSIVPIMGLADYIGRFLLNRDMVQMRSSLVILIIMWATKYAYERKPIQYFLLVLLGCQFHQMALIAVPFYFIANIKFKNWMVIAGLLVALVLSQTLAGSIESYVDRYSQDLQYTTYTTEEYKDEALGLRNPMIYFQTVILLLYCFCRKSIHGSMKYYELFKSGYFYSTLILILFSNYTALSGRTSTVFATMEMFILPYILLRYKGKERTLFALGCFAVFAFFFVEKYLPMMSRL